MDLETPDEWAKRQKLKPFKIETLSPTNFSPTIQHATRNTNITSTCCSLNVYPARSSILTNQILTHTHKNTTKPHSLKSNTHIFVHTFNPNPFPSSHPRNQQKKNPSTNFLYMSTALCLTLSPSATQIPAPIPFLTIPSPTTNSDERSRLRWYFICVAEEEWETIL